MNLRDCLVRYGIVHSKRVCALPVATQLFFRNLLHTCDGAGRFLADADDLRIALYQHALDRVTRLHVSRWLAECHTAELVRLYTGPDGRGYGEVLNYGQRDSKRKVLHPAREPDQLNFASAIPEPPSGPDPNRPEQAEPAESSAPLELNRREKKSPQPPPEAGAGEEESSMNSVQADIGYRTQAQLDRELFETLAALEGSPIAKLTQPGRAAITRALASIRRANGGLLPIDLENAAAAWKKLFPTASLTARAMATHWAKLQGPAAMRAKPSALVEPEPLGWRDWINENTPDCDYARGHAKEGTPWHDLDAGYRRYLIEKVTRRPAA